MNEFDRFVEDVRISHNSRPGARIDVPVAVCVSKLDLLAGEDYFGGHILPWLRQLREKTADRPTTLELMEQRSKMLEEVFPLLFPARNLPRFLEEHFGKRYLFFPVTPVGLEENLLLGKNKKADQIPFGVLEPILWLLHVRGYSVLPRS
jgi:hypothetical protein